MRENVQILHETRGFATSEWTRSAWAVCHILLDIIDLLEKCGIPKTQHVASGAFLRGLQSIGDFHNLLHASYLAFFCYQKTSSRKTMVVVRWYISKRKKKKKNIHHKLCMWKTSQPNRLHVLMNPLKCSWKKKKTDNTTDSIWPGCFSTERAALIHPDYTSSSADKMFLQVYDLAADR